MLMNMASPFGLGVPVNCKLYFILYNTCMKLICWNVNGIRAWYKKEGRLDWVKKQNPDFFIIQETKAHPDQLPEELLEFDDYISFFDHSKTKKGYSGVAIYAKHEPDNVIDKLGVKELDQEGRFLALEYDDFVLINCYFPNGGGPKERLEYKLKFYKEFLKFIEKFKKQGKKVIFGGDVNVAHTEIDLARPKQNVKSVGFLPEERAWIDDVIKSGWIDSFRFMYPKAVDKYTFWDMKTRSRERNVGWRIDYFFVPENLSKKIKKAEIFDDIYGSDHCPIGLEIDL